MDKNRFFGNYASFLTIKDPPWVYISTVLAGKFFADFHESSKFWSNKKKFFVILKSTENVKKWQKILFFSTNFSTSKNFFKKNNLVLRNRYLSIQIEKISKKNFKNFFRVEKFVEKNKFFCHFVSFSMLFKMAKKFIFFDQNLGLPRKSA